MVSLDSTLRKLQILLGGAVATNQLSVILMYSDKTATAYVGAAQLSTTSGATPVDICAAPAAATVRDVNYVSVRNGDTAAAAVTIRYNDNAALYTIATVTLAVGDQLVYTHGDGWRVIDATGQTKVTALSGLIAANITNTPAGGIAATTVQAAINELDTEKANLASPTFTGTVGGITAAMVGAPSGSGTSSGANTGDQTNIAGNAATVTTNANLTGDVTSVGNATTLLNAPVIAKVLTGYTSGSGTVAATDSILQAVQKLNGNDALRATDSLVAHLAGAETITGDKSFTGALKAGTHVARIKGYFGLLDWSGYVGVITTVTVGTNPYGMAYCPTNDRIYVANNGANTVSVLNPSTNIVVATVTVGTGPYWVAYCPTNDSIYVVNNGANTVSVIAPSTNTVTATITTGTAPVGVAYCPTNDRIYVSNSGGAGTVSVIIPSSNTVATTITVGAIPVGVAYCPTNDRIYVANLGPDTVSVIIPSTNTVTATVTVGADPVRIAYCPTNDRIYVTNNGAGTMSVIIPSTNTVTATITVGAAPYGVAYCPTMDRIYVVNNGANTLSIIMPSSNAVAPPVALGTGAYGILYCPTVDRIYVSNLGAGTVSILP